MDPEYLSFMELRYPGWLTALKNGSPRAEEWVNFGYTVWLAARGQAEPVKDRGVADGKLPVTVHPEEE